MSSPYPAAPDWPVAFGACTITGHFVSLSGDAVQGTVTFTAKPDALTVVDSQQVVVPVPLSAQLNVDGWFSVAIPATDDPNVTPRRWTYHVKENWTGGREYDIAAPLGKIVDLSVAAPVDSSGGIPRYFGPAGPQGVPGPVGDADLGDVILGSFPAPVKGQTVRAVDSTHATWAYPDNLNGVTVAAAAPSAGQMLRASSPTAAAWATPDRLGSVVVTDDADPADVLTATSTSAAHWAPPVQQVPAGMISHFAGATAPAGFLLCDGTVYNKSAYPALAAVLGSTYGGNGTTTFAVPDTRGRVILGVNPLTLTNPQNPVVTSVARAQVGGGLTHSHPLSDNGAARINISTSGTVWDREVALDTWTPSETFQVSAGNFTNPALTPSTTGAPLGGTTDAAGNLPPYLALNFIIKT